MSESVKSAVVGGLTGGIVALLLYLVLPSRVSIIQQPYELDKVFKVRVEPYSRAGFLRFVSEANTFKPLSPTSVEVDGIGIYYPSTTFSGNNVVDQSGLGPVEVCNSVQCGLTLTPSSALILNISNLNSLFIRNRTEDNIILEVVYYQV
ncbi:MAG: hypothetical protein QW267_06650 [Sulfolobales archaeon]